MEQQLAMLTSSINDQEIKDDAKNLITQISDELRENIRKSKSKISKAINLADTSLEEE